MGWKSSWKKNKSIFNKNSKFIEINKNKTQDIDNLDDWKLAEIKYSNMKFRYIKDNYIKKYSKNLKIITRLIWGLIPQTNILF